MNRQTIAGDPGDGSSKMVDDKSGDDRTEASTDWNNEVANTSTIEDGFKMPGGGSKYTEHGVKFQLYLIMLILWRAYNRKREERYTDFRITSQLSEAEKFDDVVFQYKNKSEKWKFRFVQAKHVKANITKTSLLSEKDNDPYSLNKYFQSFVKIKERREENSVYSVFADSEIEDVILITIADFNEEDLKKYFVQISLDTDKILNVPEPNKTKQYKLNTLNTKNDGIISKLKKIFEKHSDFSRLIQLLIGHIYKKELLKKSGLIKYYYYPLIKYVFQFGETRKRVADGDISYVNDAEQDKKKPKKFLKFSEDFIGMSKTTLPEEVIEFRKILFDKLGLPENDLKNVQIKILDGFADGFNPMENPKITEPDEFAEQIYKILQQAKKKNEKSVTINKNCVEEHEQETFEQNIRMLGGHVLISKYSKIRFSTSFIRSTKLPPDLEDFRKELKVQYDGSIEPISEFEFVIDIDRFKTCEEGALDRKLPKPYNDEDAVEFFDKFKLIVNYPNREELKKFLAEEIKTEFKILDCNALWYIFQGNIYDWLTDRMTTFYTVKRTKQLFEEICVADK